MPKQQIRLVLLGDSAVGKTVFCNLLRTKRYSPYVAQTLMTDIYSHQVDNTEFVLYDIAGSVKFRNQNTRWVQCADAALVFEDATAKKAETDWLTFAINRNPTIKLFQVRVKVECENAIHTVEPTEGIRLQDLALTQMPDLTNVLRSIKKQMAPPCKLKQNWMYFWRR
jgi:GTPase SAR1 family protein